ncbi:MAG: ABC transporter permease subunit [Polyangiaceae bacterium]|nr:ABC transporter permease subunit [Polyangiaceae bacterium]MCW5790779.1 ABC transporter permease subunit [Polyangiaceae bacterium]
MRRALRRVLWIIPTLFALSLLGFWGVTSSLGTTEGQARFFNPRPVHLGQLAERAMRRVAAGGADAEAAAAELVVLGGAALPTVLPLLDTLSPTERARVAVALKPLGERMGVGEPDELSDPEQAVLFWTRLWQDRALDFREQVAARAVSRLALKGSALREGDVIALDTFALPELMRQLGDPAARELPSDERVARTERLTAALAHITGLGWELPSDRAEATEARADALADDYERWWRQSRARFTPREGGERLVAMVRDTQYGDWLVATVFDRSEHLTSELRAASAPTLSLGLMGLAGAAALSLAALLLAPARPLGWHWLAISALPLMGVAALGSSERVAAALMALYGALRAFLVTRQAAAAHLPRDAPRLEAALGLPPWRRLLRRARAGVSYLTADLPTALPGWLSACLVIELGTGRPGLAARTLEAVSQRDVGWMMWLLLALTTVVCLAQIISDAVLGRLDPRLGAEEEP